MRQIRQCDWQTNRRENALHFRPIGFERIMPRINRSRIPPWKRILAAAFVQHLRAVLALKHRQDPSFIITEIYAFTASQCQ